MSEAMPLSRRMGTQDQNFFPKEWTEKFRYVREMGFEYFEMDGKELVDHTEEVARAIRETGVRVLTACNGYEGWIGDFDATKRKRAVEDITKILEALSEVGGKGIVVPAAWGMATYRLPPMQPSRSREEDAKVIEESLAQLDKAAQKTDTFVYLEPLNRYQDHMINTLAEARVYSEGRSFKRVKITADFYHMNIEEDGIPEALQLNRSAIGHIHLADNHRFQPGSGALDFGAAFRQLVLDNYDGLLVYECRIRGEEEAYRRSASYIKALLETEEKRLALRNLRKEGKPC